MSPKQRFLRDETGAVLAEWVVFTAVLVTLCMVSLTALRSDRPIVTITPPIITITPATAPGS